MLPLRRLSWISVLTIGCAVGLLMAATATAHSVLSRPFGASSDRVVAVFARHVTTGRERELTSFALFEDWRARATSFAHLSGYTLSTVNLLGEPAPQTIRAAQITPDFFTTLDGSPELQRVFTSQNAAADRVCVIGQALWRGRFGANPSVIGSVVHLETVNGIGPSGACTIVGIAQGRPYPERVDLWTPLTLSEASQRNRSGQWFGVVGQLRSDVSLEHARAEMSVVMRAIQTEQPGQQPPHDANLVSIEEVLTARYRVLVLGLVATSGVLLLVAAASVGGLLAARALAEQMNDRIRLGLGAGRGRLLAHAARNGAIVGVVAFAVGMPVAFACLRLLQALAAQVFDTSLAVRLTLLSATMGLACALVSSTGLALLVKAHSLAQIKTGAPWPTRTGLGAMRATTMLRRGLIVGEIALSVLLLATAADLLTRVESVRAVDLGFDTERLLTVRLALPSSRYAGERAPQFYDSLIDRVRVLPMVKQVAVSSDDPLFGVSANPEFTLQFENRVLTPEERVPILVNGVTDAYFDVLGLRLLEGETPVRTADETGALQAAINETLARRLFPNASPIGRRFRFGGRNPPWWTIVGVVADARNDGPLASPKPTAYLSYPAFGKPDMTLLVKTTGNVDALVPDIRAIIAALDPNIAIARIASATDLVEARFANLRIGALVIAVLATAALILSGLGLYGVLTAIFTQGRSEIGLRIALGASPGDMMRLVLRRAGTMTTAGVMLGAICTITVAAMLRKIVPIDLPAPTSVLVLMTTVAAVALLAAVLPAWRATQVNPVESLRTD